MFRKILIAIICLIGVELSFLNVTSAELRVYDIDKNGYKTCFDTESLQKHNVDGQKIIEVRIVGFRPDNSKIMDIQQYFTVINNELYACVSVDMGKWYKCGEKDYKTWYALLEYVSERAS